MTHDIEIKRAEYIAKTVELRENLSFASPVEILSATDIYCSDYYGSLAGWDLGRTKAATFFNAWNTHVKLTWQVPRNTRTYLMQQVLASGFISARSAILARFVSFFRALRVAPSHEVRTIAFLVSRDMRSVTGRNLELVRQLSGQDPWAASPTRVKESLMERELVGVPERDTWRCSYLRKLLEQRQFAHYNGDTDTEIHLSDVIDSLCNS